MQPLEIAAAIAGIGSFLFGIASFAFAVYQSFKSRNERLAERAKLEIQKERMRNIQFNVNSALHTADGIVQIGKKEGVTVGEMQDLTRILRAQLYVLREQVQKEQGRLKEWKYGELIPSNSPSESEKEELTGKRLMAEADDETGEVDEAAAIKQQAQQGHTT